MYNEKDIQFAGKHDFVPATAPSYQGAKTVSLGVYKLVLRSNGKSLKPSKAIVRVSGSVDNIDAINRKAQEVVNLLDGNHWYGAKTVKI